ncbi:hypothetical protein GCM10009741_43020 [Kribbella lupini]
MSEWIEVEQPRGSRNPTTRAQQKVTSTTEGSPRIVDPQDLRLESWPMSELTRAQIRDLMGEVMKAQGKELPSDDSADLREIGFRSLDFSELALRVEDEIGDELNFDAPGLRQIAKVGDVLDFIEQLQSA